MMDNELRPYEAYKETGLFWQNEIPSHWGWQFLSQSCQEKCYKNSMNMEKNVLSLSYGQIIRKKNIDFGLVPKEYSGYQIVEEGNIILRLTDLQNDKKSLRTGLVKERGIITSAYTCLYTKNNHPNFIHYLLHAYDLKKVFYGLGGGVRQSIGYEDIRKIKLPIPPRLEQDEIVRFLDHKLAKINKFIKAKKKLIAVLKEQKQAIINEAVTKGLDPNVKMKPSGIEWLGDVPEHWEIKFLFQVAKEQNTSNRSEKIQNLLSLSYGEIVRKYINRTDGLLPQSYDTYQIVHEGNLVLRMTDLQNDKKSIRVGYVKETGIVTSAYIVLEVREFIAAQFLSYVLHSYDYIKVFYGMGGGVRQGISFKDLKKLSIVCPDLCEQEKIVQYLNISDNRVQLQIQTIEREIELLIEYKTSLISDVVTGKIDVRHIAITEAEAIDLEDIELDEDTMEADEILDAEEVEA